MSPATSSGPTNAPVPDEVEALKNFMELIRSTTEVSSNDWHESGDWLVEHSWWWYLQTLHLALSAKDKEGEAFQRKVLKIRRSMLLTEEKKLGRMPTIDDVRADFPDIEMSEALLSLVAHDLELVKQPIRRRSQHEVFMEKIAKLQQQAKKSKAAERRAQYKAKKKAARKKVRS